MKKFSDYTRKIIIIDKEEVIQIIDCINTHFRVVDILMKYEN